MLHSINKLSIPRKLYLIIAVMLTCMIMIGAFTFQQINKLTELNSAILKQPYTVGLVLRDIENDTTIIDKNINLITTATDKSESFILETGISEATQNALAQLIVIEERIPQNKESVEALRKLFSDWLQLRNAIIKNINSGNSNKAKNLVKINSSNLLSQINYHLVKMRGLETGTAFDLSEKSKKARQEIITHVPLAFIFTILISGILVFFIAKSIATPIRSISKTMKAISESQIDEPIPYSDRGDEIGIMARSTEVFRQYASNINKLNDQLKAHDRLKSEFFANMNHELRTPLNGIMGMCQLLKMSELDEVQTRNVDNIVTCGKSLLSMVNDLLDFSQLQAGTMEFIETEYDIRELVKKSIASQHIQAHQKSLEISSNFTHDVGGTYLGDPIHIKQCLTILINNAVKFTEKGKVEIYVEKTNTNQLLFRVCDTGIGIKIDQTGNIFEKFRQLDSSAIRIHGGTGLGLAICKELVSQMGGTIGVDSIPGEGSEFWFELPLKQAHNLNVARRAVL